MNLQFASFLRALSLASIKAKPGDKPDEKIDGYPEFASTIDTLHSPEVDDKLDKLAKRIVASHSTSDKIIGFEVHGHADLTLRPPPGQTHEEVEKSVSDSRAHNAKDLLLELIKKNGGESIITGIISNTDAKGFGSEFRIHKPATNDKQRDENKRIEIFLRHFKQPPPPPPKPEPPKPPEPGKTWRIKIKSGQLTNLLVAGAVNFSMNIEITDIVRNQKGTFEVSAKGIFLGMGATAFIPLKEGTDKPFETTSAVTLNNFTGAVKILQNPGDSSFNFDFEALSPAKTVGSVAVNAGSAPIPPAIGPGLATGSLTLQGKPTP